MLRQCVVNDVPVRLFAHPHVARYFNRGIKIQNAQSDANKLRLSGCYDIDRRAARAAVKACFLGSGRVGMERVAASGNIELAGLHS